MTRCKSIILEGYYEYVFFRLRHKAVIVKREGAQLLLKKRLQNATLGLPIINPSALTIFNNNGFN